jgi:hypothetical protein
MLDICSTKWGYSLLGLELSLRGSKAAPYPHNARINSWA